MPAPSALATGRAIVEAARERRVGAPVYLRYAAEIAPTEDIVEAAAAAVEYAAQVLGPALDVYAVAAVAAVPTATGRDAGPDGDRPGQPAHLALTVRHRDGSVALLGIGRRPIDAKPVSPSVLLVGDRGVVEGCHPPTLPGTPAAHADPTLGGTSSPQASANGAAAIRRSLRSGRPAPIQRDG